MIGYLKIGHNGLTEALDFDVMAVVRANGHGGVDYIGNVEHDGADACGVLLLKRFKLRKAVGVLLHLRLYRLGLRGLGRILLRLPHEHAYLLGKRIAACTKLARLGYGRAVLLVQLQHLIHQRQLRVLKLLLYVLLDYLGVLSHKTYIQHNFFAPAFNAILCSA